MQALHFNSHNEPEHNKCTIVYSLNDIQQILNEIHFVECKLYCLFLTMEFNGSRRGR